MTFKKKFRESLDGVKASESLIKNTLEQFRNENGKTITLTSYNRRKNMNSTKKHRKIAVSTAAAFAAVIIVLNAVPSIAYAANDVPVLGSIVRVLTLDRFTGNSGGLQYDITVPQLDNLTNRQLEDTLNEQLRDNAAAVLEQFKKDEAEFEQAYPDAKAEVVHGYNVVTNTDDIFSIKIYTFAASGGSDTVNKFYTIDKKTGNLLTLPGMFKEKSDYTGVISDYIRGEMEKQNTAAGNELYSVSDFKEINPVQKFYINSDGALVIAFDKYEVAAGVMGTPEFVIPKSVTADISTYNFKN
jgi:hypothetical protein